jgi:large repetitive protein
VTGLLLTMAGVVAAVRPASAQPPGMDVSCGAIVTTNVTLGRDLIDCPNNGIVIGADNITIDLNGHTVDGDETLVEPCPAGELCDGGIVNVGHVGVTVTTGSISDFAAGVFLRDGADRNQLRHLSVTRSMFPGVLIIDSAHVTVEKNRISGNGVTTGDAGIRLFGVNRALIRGNRVSANGGDGLSALASSDHNRIEGNTFSGNPEAGLGLEGAGNEVASNRFLGQPVILIGDDNILRKNYVADPPACDDGCGIGISFEGGARNVIEENVVVRAPIRGIRIDAYVGAAVNNIVRGNIVRDAGVDGIGINLDHVGDVTGSLVERNLVTGSGDDGIDVESPSTTLRGNLAVHNGDLGIEAMSGVTDGGGNRAFANGNPLQCTNIQCSAARAAH